MQDHPSSDHRESEDERTNQEFPENHRPDSNSRVKRNKPQHERFGKYEILRVLGEGGMGAVYLARESEAGRNVALKLPKLEESNYEETLNRFLREARTASSLNHPNICPIHEYGDVEGQFFLSMEFIEGAPLSKYLNGTKPVSSRQIALLIRKLATAVAAAHDAGIIHRDLKPANVMVNRRGEPVVMDFGLARNAHSDDTQLTRTGAFVGTPAYVSPEQITNRKGEVDHRTDIYSLGVIMYQLLAGRLPYDASNSVNMIAQVLEGDPAPPSNYNQEACPRLTEIAMKAIARDVRQRYQSMQELANDLTRYLKGDTAPRGTIHSDDEWTDAEFTQGPVTASHSIDGEAIDFLNIDFQEFEATDPLGNQQTSQHLPPRTHRRSRAERIDATEEAKHRDGRMFAQTDAQLAQLKKISLSVAVLLLGWLAFSVLRAPSGDNTEYGSLQVELKGIASDVQLSLDGEKISIGELSSGYSLPVGPHVLIGKATGFDPQIQEFSIAGDESKQIVLSFERKPPPAAWMNASLADANHTPQTTAVQLDDEEKESSEKTLVYSDRPDIVFQDFESGDYGDWIASGLAFGDTPHEPLRFPEQLNSVPCALDGAYVADSYFRLENGAPYGAHEMTGKLVSPKFVIERDYINFLVAMGTPNEAEVRLTVDGETIVSSTGDPAYGMIMHPMAWDVSDLEGQTAQIEVVDESQRSQGHVCVDLFVFSDADRTGEMKEQIARTTVTAAEEFNGHRYFFSPVNARIQESQIFAEMVGGNLLQVETDEEAQFIAQRMREPVWLGLTQEGGAWKGLTGGLYTHFPWQDGCPEGEWNTTAVLSETGRCDFRWNYTRYFVVEFGPREEIPPHTIQAADRQREAAQLLLQKTASLVVATPQKFVWLEPGKQLPAEDFELRRVFLAKGTKFTPEDLKTFEGIDTITWLKIEDSDDSAIELLKYTPRLIDLSVSGGTYSWEALNYLAEGHPLRTLKLAKVAANRRQLQPLFEGTQIENLSFTQMRLDPEISKLISSQKNTLRSLWLNGTGGFRRSSFQELGDLEKLQELILYASGVTDHEFRYFAKMKSLETLGLGMNKEVTGANLPLLESLKSLQTLKLWDTSTTDANLTRLPVLPELRALMLAGTPITGRTLSHLAQFPRLTHLNLRATAIGDEELTPLMNVMSIQKIEAEKSRITPAMMQQFKRSRPRFTSDL